MGLLLLDPIGLRRTAAGIALALLAGALSDPATAATAIKFSLDFKFDGPAAPFLLALDKGYYKAEGLDVTIDTATGSLEPVARVAAGTYDMGFGDINSLIKFRDQNAAAPVKAVFMVYNRAPFAIVARKSRGVLAPKDLEGKKLGATAADSAFAQWKVFVQANGIDASKVMVETIGFPVRDPMLAAGQLDAIAGFSFSSYINLKDRGVPTDDIVVLPMSDYGVSLYGDAIMVSPKFAAEHPQAVRGFLRAFVKGLKETLHDPTAAVDSVITRNDAAKKDVELERLDMALRDNVMTDEVRADGLGGIDANRLERSIGQLASAYGLKLKPKPSDIFDSSYLPSMMDRKVN